MKKLCIILFVLMLSGVAFADDIACIASKYHTSGANVHIGKGRLYGISFTNGTARNYYLTVYDSTTGNAPPSMRMPAGSAYGNGGGGKMGAIRPTSGGQVQITRRYSVSTAADIWFDTSIRYKHGLYVFIEYPWGFDLNTVRYMLYFDPE